MGVDWGFAGQIGGIGFGLVFVVLIILAVAIWLVGLIISRTNAEDGTDDSKDSKKGA